MARLWVAARRRRHPLGTPGTCVSTVTVVEVIPLSEEELSELPAERSVCCESAVRQELPKMAHEHARTVRRAAFAPINNDHTDPRIQTCTGSGLRNGRGRAGVRSLAVHKFRSKRAREELHCNHWPIHAAFLALASQTIWFWCCPSQCMDDESAAREIQRPRAGGHGQPCMGSWTMPTV